MELFSEYFEKLLLEQSDYFENGLIKGAYLIGAYSKGIIDSSYNPNGKVVKKNETFKKWLSTKRITESNLKAIFNKASYFERLFSLNTPKNNDLSQLVTTHFVYPKNIRVAQQEISFAFIRGFNDYAKFKKENQKQGEDDE